MNTIANYKIGDKATLTENFTLRYQGNKRGRLVREGVVVELSDRVRVLWGTRITTHNGVEVARRVDGKRTWIAPDRLVIVTGA